MQESFKYAHEAGLICEARILDEIAKGNVGKLLRHLDVVTENLYQQLPSGDYGRGDVRLLVEETIAKSVLPPNRGGPRTHHDLPDHQDA